LPAACELLPLCDGKVLAHGPAAIDSLTDCRRHDVTVDRGVSGQRRLWQDREGDNAATERIIALLDQAPPSTPGGRQPCAVRAFTESSDDRYPLYKKALLQHPSI
jgi:hypothetical protein